MLAVAMSFVVPAIERWGVLVTNLGATVIMILGAMYVFSLFLVASHNLLHPIATRSPGPPLLLHNSNSNDPPSRTFALPLPPSTTALRARWVHAYFQ